MQSFSVVFFNKTCESKLCNLDQLYTPTVVKRKDDGQAMFSKGKPPEVRHSKFSYTRWMKDNLFYYLSKVSSARMRVLC